MEPTIVLAHGIARFDELFVILKQNKELYFNGVADHLRAHGFTVEEPVVAFADSVGERSRQLASKIKGRGPVHVIAHSMGGLDARYAISKRRTGGRRSPTSASSTAATNSSAWSVGPPDSHCKAFAIWPPLPAAPSMRLRGRRRRRTASNIAW